MKKMLFLGMLAVSFLILVSGCGKSVFWSDEGKQTESDKIIIDKDKAKELALELNIGVGELNVEKGAKEWIEGKAEYNHEGLKPIVSYDLDGKTGVAVIDQKDIKLKNLKNVKNNWNLRLNNDVPIDLKINSGATDTKLNLRGLQLSNLEVNAGVGNITIDLRDGKWKDSFNTQLKIGIGKSTILLPADVGVKIIANKGIGKSEFVGLISKGNGVYVNEAYDGANVVININADLGIGEAIFKVME